MWDATGYPKITSLRLSRLEHEAQIEPPKRYLPPDDTRAQARGSTDSRKRFARCGIGLSSRRTGFGISLERLSRAGRGHHGVSGNGLFTVRLRRFRCTHGSAGCEL